MWWMWRNSFFETRKPFLSQNLDGAKKHYLITTHVHCKSKYMTFSPSPLFSCDLALQCIWLQWPLKKWQYFHSKKSSWRGGGLPFHFLKKSRSQSNQSQEKKGGEGHGGCQNFTHKVKIEIRISPPKHIRCISDFSLASGQYLYIVSGSVPSSLHAKARQGQWDIT